MLRFWLFVALLSCFAATSMGQGFPPSQAQPGQVPAASPVMLIPRTHEERERRYRAIHHMILNVLAVDEFNRPVTGLKAQDFVLMDNGQPQELASFREVNGNQGIGAPHVVLILDAVNNTRRSIAFEIKEIGKYMGSNQGRLLYPTSIATLTSSGFKASHTSTDGSVLLQESRDSCSKTFPPIYVRGHRRMRRMRIRSQVMATTTSAFRLRKLTTAMVERTVHTLFDGAY